jgi:hypothetical protein
MRGMLIAYDERGNVIHTLDYMVVLDPDTQEPLGMLDFLLCEENGIGNIEFWKVLTYDLDENGNKVLRDPQPVKGSKVWPEWIGGSAHQFRVILAGPPGRKRIVKLIHKQSGHVRDREQIEAAIAERVEKAKAQGVPADLRDLLGGPDRPLKLDEDGRNRPRAGSARKQLPVVAVGKGRARPSK